MIHRGVGARVTCEAEGEEEKEVVKCSDEAKCAPRHDDDVGGDDEDDDDDDEDEDEGNVKPVDGESAGDPLGDGIRW